MLGLLGLLAPRRLDRDGDEGDHEGLLGRSQQARVGVDPLIGPLLLGDGSLFDLQFERFLNSTGFSFLLLKIFIL